MKSLMKYSYSILYWKLPQREPPDDNSTPNPTFKCYFRRVKFVVKHGEGVTVIVTVFLLRNDRRQNVELSYCNALEQIGGKSPRTKMMWYDLSYLIWNDMIYDMICPQKY